MHPFVASHQLLLWDPKERFSWLSYSTHTRGSSHACVHLQTSIRYSEVTQKMTQCQSVSPISSSWYILNRGRQWQKHGLNPNFLWTIFAEWKIFVSCPLHSGPGKSFEITPDWLFWIWNLSRPQGQGTGGNVNILTVTKIIWGPSCPLDSH